jgi:hypothetical protein
MGHVMAHAVVKSLNAGARVRVQNSACGICDGPSGTGTGLFLISSDSPCQYHSNNAPGSFFCHPWRIITTNKGVVKNTPETPYEYAPLRNPKSYIRLLEQVSIRFNRYNLYRKNVILFRKLNTYIMQSTQFFLSFNSIYFCKIRYIFQPKRIQEQKQLSGDLSHTIGSYPVSFYEPAPVDDRHG